MSTRGACGFYVNGKTKVQYNHHDSYPEGLGEDILSWLREYVATRSVHEFRTRASKVKLVDGESRPTKTQLARYRKTLNLRVDAARPEVSWYQLLRESQGQLEQILHQQVMINSEPFLDESLFCEWAYIINLDDETFEVYKGFNTNPGGAGRYCERRKVESIATALGPERDKYHPVTLLATFPLNDLPADLTSVRQLVDDND